MANALIYADRDTICETIAENYIRDNTITLTDLIDRAKQIRTEIIESVNNLIIIENQTRGKENKIRKLDSLPGYVVAMLLIATGDIKRVNMGSWYQIVSKYYYKNKLTNYEWKWSGQYETVSDGNDDNLAMMIFAKLCPNGTSHDERTMIRHLAANADTAILHADNTIVYFRNGVWDYNTATFTAYDDPAYSEKYGDKIVLTKLPTYHPYGPGAVLTPDADGKIAEPVYHNDSDGTEWRPTDCINDPFDLDTATGRASNTIIWQLLQFMIRHVNGSPQLYHFWIDEGGKGHNGKSTLWEAMERIISKKREYGDDDLKSCGETVIHCSIENLDKDYLLAENIMTAYAIVGEESDAATRAVDACATLKDLSRAQEHTYRKIRGNPFKYAFDGALIQQLNKSPIFSEKTDSVVSHSVNIMFTKSFDDSRPYIKDDYIRREETAEYLVYVATVLMPLLSEYDQESLKILKPFQKKMLIDGLSTMQALEEIIPKIKMNYIPSEILYDLYLRWCDKNGVVGPGVVSAKLFRDDLMQYVIANPDDFDFVKKNARVSVKDLEEDHDALRDFGYSAKYGYSRFVSRGAQYNTSETNFQHFRGKFEKSEFVDAKGAAKIWSKGGIKRLIRWQDLPPVADDLDIMDAD